MVLFIQEQVQEDVQILEEQLAKAQQTERQTEVSRCCQLEGILSLEFIGIYFTQL